MVNAGTIELPYGHLRVDEWVSELGTTVYVSLNRSDVLLDRESICAARRTPIFGHTVHTFGLRVRWGIDA